MLRPPVPIENNGVMSILHNRLDKTKRTRNMARSTPVIINLFYSYSLGVTSKVSGLTRVSGRPARMTDRADSTTGVPVIGSSETIAIQLEVHFKRE